MQRYPLGPITLELTVGDITSQPDVEVVVNAANAQLTTGGGVAGAIHRAAGPRLDEACRPLAPIAPGEAVLTEGFDLPNRAVVHVLGPVFGRDEPSADLLASCYRQALLLAEEERYASIAFPAVSTGAFGYPLEAAAEVALRAVTATAPQLANVRTVRFVLHDDAALATHRRALDALS